MAKQHVRAASPPRKRDCSNWLIAAFRPVTLFSLRMTHATSKGGKTLVCPTPYAVKMALLDACFRAYDGTEAETRARAVFDWIKRRDVRFRPPKHCVVNNTFVKALDWNREPVDGPFRNTIVYREFAFFDGDELLIALGIEDLKEQQTGALKHIFAHINYLGKRGGFWQFMGVQEHDGNLSFGFTVPRTDVSLMQAGTYGMTQALDDFTEALCEAKDGFDRVSTFGSGSVRLGEQRTLVATAVPYIRTVSSRHFTRYERVKELDQSR